MTRRLKWRRALAFSLGSAAHPGPGKDERSYCQGQSTASRSGSVGNPDFTPSFISSCGKVAGERCKWVLLQAGVYRPGGLLWGSLSLKHEYQGPRVDYIYG